MRLNSEKMLMGETSAYEDGQVLFESSTPESYNLNIEETANYEVYCIAGGSGGVAVGGTSTARSIAIGGASGSGFIGVVHLNKAMYPITVGNGGKGDSGTYRYTATSEKGGDSSIGNAIVSYGGESCTTNGNTSAVAGAGGSIPTISVQIVSQTLKTAGNQGSILHYWGKSTPGAAVYGNYGAGGSSNAQSAGSSNESGNSGYIKIVYKGK